MCMEKFFIKGGNKLYGKAVVQTSKNATLPILSACILTKNKVVINKIPNITDIDNMLEILKSLNVKCTRIGSTVTLNPKNAKNIKVDCKLARTMRSSVFLLGSMLGRFKTAFLSLPGGCKIGARPIDIHIDALKKLNVSVEEVGDYLYFNATRAKANRVKLRLASVGATENIIEFASTLKGKTTILNPAREPEIVDLCNFLNLMGAKIYGAGTKKITIYGVDSLYGAIYTPMGDRIVAGTLMIATAMCGGDVTLENAVPYQNENIIKKLVKMGCQIDIKSDIIHIVRERPLVSIGKIVTGFYPEFPTDLQSMMTVLSCTLMQPTYIRERVFENRFLIVDELKKMGANISKMDENCIVVRAGELKGCEVCARDLRGGASLILAGLVAEGTTIVTGVQFIERGYEQIEQVLSSLNADIKKYEQKSSDNNLNS